MGRRVLRLLIGEVSNGVHGVSQVGRHFGDTHGIFDQTCVSAEGLNSSSLNRVVTGVPIKWASICEQALDALRSPDAAPIVNLPYPRPSKALCAETTGRF